MASYEQIVVERRERAVCVTLNQPERRNPLTAAMLAELIDAADAAVADGARALIITGAGKGFCAGGDVASMATGFGGQPTATPQPWRARAGVLAYYRMCMRVSQLPVPTIAAINGAAVGAGLNLALACDIRLASRAARFGASFLKIGLPPGMGASWLLTRAVGAARAAELIFSAEPVGAEEADRMGLVNRVVPDDALLPEAWALAHTISSGPPLALAMAKQALRLALEADHETVLQFEAMAQAAAAQTDDLHEGLAAFLEKRTPEFKGR